MPTSTKMEMMRSRRHVSIDHPYVGWYQSTYYGSFVSRALLDARYREVRGANLRLKKANIGYEHMFGEVPIVIKDSNLMNVLMWELVDKRTVAEKHKLLSLSSSNHLEKSLQMLMDRVDDTSQEIVKYNTYCRNLSKQQQQQQQQKHQYLQRRQQENAQRQSRGEPPEVDIGKMFKPPPPPLRMHTLLIAGARRGNHSH